MDSNTFIVKALLDRQQHILEAHMDVMVTGAPNLKEGFLSNNQ